jgi:hypothetical protein
MVAFSSVAISWRIAGGYGVAVAIDRDNRGERHCYLTVSYHWKLAGEKTRNQGIRAMELAEGSTEAQ